MLGSILVSDRRLSVGFYIGLVRCKVRHRCELLPDLVRRGQQRADLCCSQSLAEPVNVLHEFARPCLSGNGEPICWFLLDLLLLAPANAKQADLASRDGQRACFASISTIPIEWPRINLAPRTS